MDSGEPSTSGSSNEHLASDLVRLTSLALTGPPATIIPWVLALNVLRNVFWLVDSWIVKFTPTLPNEWIGERRRNCGEARSGLP